MLDVSEIYKTSALFSLAPEDDRNTCTAGVGRWLGYRGGGEFESRISI